MSCDQLRAREAALKERALVVRERELLMRARQLQLLARLVALAEATPGLGRSGLLTRLLEWLV